MFNTYALYFCWDAVFAEIKPPEGTAPASKVGWSYPIAFRSLVVGLTALTQNFPKINKFSNFFRTIWDVHKIDQI